ncbi:uncharacterized protein LOC21407206 isoform X2 [Morus notabilis]|uniref:uncharacterized protein LOC21407206 isoform X2 n=1 Tax=Morus notabilis TaxID=981085 RepID=UPI000CED2421|nr:uncharacterized protein LOC21407206 isoform X2 [Morus notabilis]
MSEVILDREENSAEDRSRSSSPQPPPPYRDGSHSPPRRSPPPPPPLPSSYKRPRMDDGRIGEGFEPGDTRRMPGFCDLPEKRTSVNLPYETINSDASNSFMTINKEDGGNDPICFATRDFSVPESVVGVRGSHCNGILFLPDKDTDKVLLCNPAIREFKLLRSSCFGSNFKTQVMVGFGYDAIANVYKVVRVVRLHGTSVGACIAAEICTLGNRDSWREIKMKIEIDITSLTFDELYHKGIYYWVIDDKFMKNMLISFDMHVEEFQTIPLPEDHDLQEFRATSSTKIIHWKLGLWKESVTLFKYVKSIAPNSYAQPIKMWILDEISSSCQEKSFCWTKCADLLFGGTLQYYPLVFWKSDELLLRTSEIGLYASYNLRTQKLRNMKLHFFNDRSIHAFVYMESLVSMPGARKMISSS